MSTHSYFSIQNITPIEFLKPNSKIHVIGVCGVAMAPLAVALSKQGFIVSGSDREYYEPMASVLKKQNIKLYEGFKKENITPDLDLVVIGNIASKDHPEVLQLQEFNLKYTIFTQSLYDILIKGRHSIVVSGTHGKTTTTALCATTLNKLGVDTSYFVGGQVKELDLSFHVGKDAFSVVEGDEYDSAFFAKVPKFSFYKPNTLIVTSIEYDHADIYPDLESIEKEFTKLVNSLGAEDNCICCIDNENIKKLLPSWRDTKQAKTKFLTYGFSEEADFVVTSKDFASQGFQEVSIEFNSKNKIVENSIIKELIKNKITYKIPLSGKYSALNSCAILLALRLNKFSMEKIVEAFSTFKGVKRRQDVIINNEKLTLIEDFAHHPTAVKETLQGIINRYPKRRLIAIFEPRSNTSRRPVFRTPYRDALCLADLIILGEVKRREIDRDLELVESQDIANDIIQNGKEAFVCADANEIVELIEKRHQSGDLVVVMSNGGFGGVIEKVKEKFL